VIGEEPSNPFFYACDSLSSSVTIKKACRSRLFRPGGGARCLADPADPGRAGRAGRSIGVFRLAHQSVKNVEELDPSAPPSRRLAGMWKRKIVRLVAASVSLCLGVWCRLFFFPPVDLLVNFLFASGSWALAKITTVLQVQTSLPTRYSSLLV
jgi:hypothetical protein